MESKPKNMVLPPRCHILYSNQFANLTISLSIWFDKREREREGERKNQLSLMKVFFPGEMQQTF